MTPLQAALAACLAGRHAWTSWTTIDVGCDNWSAWKLVRRCTLCGAEEEA